jgi:hypothetical protein
VCRLEGALPCCNQGLRKEEKEGRRKKRERGGEREKRVRD